MLTTEALHAKAIVSIMILIEVGAVKPASQLQDLLPGLRLVHTL
jgi:hypothetical protein